NFAVLETAVVGAKSGIRGEIVSLHAPAAARELFVAADGEDDMSVGGREPLIGYDIGMTVAEALRDDSGDEIVRRLVGEHGDLRVEQAQIEMLAHPRLTAPMHRGEDADHRIETGKQIGDRNTCLHRTGTRRAIGLAGQAHEPAHRLYGEMIARTMTGRAGLSESSDRTIDEPGGGGRHPLVVEAIFGECAGAEVLNQDIRLSGKRENEIGSLLAGKIDGDRTLVAIGAKVIGRLAAAFIGGEKM